MAHATNENQELNMNNSALIESKVLSTQYYTCLL